MYTIIWNKWSIILNPTSTLIMVLTKVKFESENSPALNDFLEQLLIKHEDLEWVDRLSQTYKGIASLNSDLAMRKKVVKRDYHHYRKRRKLRPHYTNVKNHKNFNLEEIPQLNIEDFENGMSGVLKKDDYKQQRVKQLRYIEDIPSTTYKYKNTDSFDWSLINPLNWGKVKKYHATKSGIRNLREKSTNLDDYVQYTEQSVNCGSKPVDPDEFGNLMKVVEPITHNNTTKKPKWTKNTKLGIMNSKKKILTITKALSIRHKNDLSSATNRILVLVDDTEKVLEKKSITLPHQINPFKKHTPGDAIPKKPNIQNNVEKNISPTSTHVEQQNFDCPINHSNLHIMTEASNNLQKRDKMLELSFSVMTPEEKKRAKIEAKKLMDVDQDFNERNEPNFNKEVMKIKSQDYKDIYDYWENLKDNNNQKSKTKEKPKLKPEEIEQERFLSRQLLNYDYDDYENSLYTDYNDQEDGLRRYPRDLSNNYEFLNIDDDYFNYPNDQPLEKMFYKKRWKKEANNRNDENPIENRMKKLKNFFGIGHENNYNEYVQDDYPVDNLPLNDYTTKYNNFIEDITEKSENLQNFNEPYDYSEKLSTKVFKHPNLGSNKLDQNSITRSTFAVKSDNSLNSFDPFPIDINEANEENNKNTFEQIAFNKKTNNINNKPIEKKPDTSSGLKQRKINSKSNHQNPLKKISSSLKQNIITPKANNHIFLKNTNEHPNLISSKLDQNSFTRSTFATKSDNSLNCFDPFPIDEANEKNNENTVEQIEHNKKTSNIYNKPIESNPNIDSNLKQTKINSKKNNQNPLKKIIPNMKQNIITPKTNNQISLKESTPKVILESSFGQPLLTTKQTNNKITTKTQSSPQKAWHKNLEISSIMRNTLANDYSITNSKTKNTQFSSPGNLAVLDFSTKSETTTTTPFNPLSYTFPYKNNRFGITSSTTINFPLSNRIVNIGEKISKRESKLIKNLLERYKTKSSTNFPEKNQNINIDDTDINKSFYLSKPKIDKTKLLKNRNIKKFLTHKHKFRHRKYHSKFQDMLKAIPPQIPFAQMHVDELKLNAIKKNKQKGQKIHVGIKTREAKESHREEINNLDDDDYISSDYGASDNSENMLLNGVEKQEHSNRIVKHNAENDACCKTRNHKHSKNRPDLEHEKNVMKEIGNKKIEDHPKSANKKNKKVHSENNKKELRKVVGKKSLLEAKIEIKKCNDSKTTCPTAPTQKYPAKTTTCPTTTKKCPTTCKTTKNTCKTTKCPTTCKPTTCKPTTCKPTTCKTTTCKPTTCKPTTCKPTTCKTTKCPTTCMTTKCPTTCKPTTCKPTTCKPTTCKTTTYKTTTCKPTTCKPTTCKPTTCKPTTCKPTTCKPITCKPTTCKPSTCKTTKCPTTCKPTTFKTTKCPTTCKPTTKKCPTTCKTTKNKCPTTCPETKTTNSCKSQCAHSHSTYKIGTKCTPSCLHEHGGKFNCPKCKLIRNSQYFKNRYHRAKFNPNSHIRHLRFPKKYQLYNDMPKNEYQEMKHRNFINRLKRKYFLRHNKNIAVASENNLTRRKKSINLNKDVEHTIEMPFYKVYPKRRFQRYRTKRRKIKNDETEDEKQRKVLETIYHHRIQRRRNNPEYVRNKNLPYSYNSEVRRKFIKRSTILDTLENANYKGTTPSDSSFNSDSGKIAAKVVQDLFMEVNQNENIKNVIGKSLRCPRRDYTCKEEVKRSGKKLYHIIDDVIKALNSGVVVKLKNDNSCSELDKDTELFLKLITTDKKKSKKDNKNKTTKGKTTCVTETTECSTVPTTTTFKTKATKTITTKKPFALKVEISSCNANSSTNCESRALAQHRKKFEEPESKNGVKRSQRIKASLNKIPECSNVQFQDTMHKLPKTHQELMNLLSMYSKLSSVEKKKNKYIYSYLHTQKLLVERVMHQLRTNARRRRRLNLRNHFYELKHHQAVWQPSESSSSSINTKYIKLKKRMISDNQKKNLSIRKKRENYLRDVMRTGRYIEPPTLSKLDEWMNVDNVELHETYVNFTF